MEPFTQQNNFEQYLENVRIIKKYSSGKFKKWKILFPYLSRLDNEKYNINLPKALIINSLENALRRYFFPPFRSIHAVYIERTEKNHKLYVSL